MTKSPLVSIICPTYNHEAYIAQAIEGFLMQKTNFDYEIIINDDASTDATKEIVMSYERNHPSIFRNIYQTENQFSKDVSSVSRIMFTHAKGKYLALCEGDDYWTDPYKLQKQVDFLEANPDFGLVHTNYNYWNEENDSTNSVDFPRSTGHIFLNLLKGNEIATLTVLFRTAIIPDLINSGIFEKNFLMGDYPMWLFIAERSKIGYLADHTAVYRKRIESVSNTINPLKKLLFNKSALNIQTYFAQKSEAFVVVRDYLIEQHKYYLKKARLHQSPIIAKGCFWFLLKNRALDSIDIKNSISVFFPAVSRSIKYLFN